MPPMSRWGNQAFWVAFWLLLHCCYHVCCHSDKQLSSPPLKNGTLRVSFYYPTDPSDLGYTYRLNLARRRLISHLDSIYPWLSVEQRIVNNINTMSTPAYRQLIREEFLNRTTNIIFLLSSDFVSRVGGYEVLHQWNAEAKALRSALLAGGGVNTSSSNSFPNFWHPDGVAVVELNVARFVSTRPRDPYNVAGTFFGQQEALFLLGAASGAVCDPARPIAVIVASLVSKFVSPNAFHRGVLFGQRFRDDVRNATNASMPSSTNTTTSDGAGAPTASICKVIGINKNTFSNVPTELELTDLFIRIKNASTIVLQSNNIQWTLAIQERFKILSEGRQTPPVGGTAAGAVTAMNVFTDGTLVVGDAVTASAVLDATDAFIDAVDTFLRTDVFMGDQAFYIKIAPGRISSRAPSGASVAVAAAERYLRSLSNQNPICGASYDGDGVLRWAAANSSSDTCMTFAMSQALQYGEYGVTILPDFRGAAATCPPGTYSMRNVSTFALTCAPCGPGLYSSAAGSAACVACIAGWQPNRNQSGCVYVTHAQASLPYDALVGVVVTCACLGVLSVGLAVWYAYWARVYRSWWWGLRRVPLHDRIAYPKGPSVALVLFGIESVSSSTTQWRRSVTIVADVYEVLHRVVEEACLRSGMYIFINVGDAYAAAHDDPVAVMECVTVITVTFRTALARRFPRGSEHHHLCEHLIVRALVHWGRPVIVPPSSANPRAQFTGNCIRVLKTLWGAGTEIVFKPNEQRIVPTSALAASQASSSSSSCSSVGSSVTVSSSFMEQLTQALYPDLASKLALRAETLRSVPALTAARDSNSGVMLTRPGRTAFALWHVDGVSSVGAALQCALIDTEVEAFIDALGVTSFTRSSLLVLSGHSPLVVWVAALRLRLEGFKRRATASARRWMLLVSRRIRGFRHQRSAEGGDVFSTLSYPLLPTAMITISPSLLQLLQIPEETFHRAVETLRQQAECDAVNYVAAASGQEQIRRGSSAVHVLHGSSSRLVDALRRQRRDHELIPSASPIADGGDEEELEVVARAVKDFCVHLATVPRFSSVPSTPQRATTPTGVAAPQSPGGVVIQHDASTMSASVNSSMKSAVRSASPKLAGSATQPAASPRHDISPPQAATVAAMDNAADPDVAVSLISAEEFGDHVLFFRKLLLLFISVCPAENRMDLILFAAARLRLDIHACIALPYGVTAGHSFSGLAAAFAAVLGHVVGVEKESGRVRTVAHQVAPVAIRLIAKQIVIAMDEAELAVLGSEIAQTRAAAQSKRNNTAVVGR